MVMHGGRVSIVLKHERIPKWMSFSGKVGQEMVVSLTTVKTSAITLKVTSLTSFRLV